MIIVYYLCRRKIKYKLMNLNVLITLHLIEKRQKTFGGVLRTILLFPLAIIGDTCLVIAYLIALMVSNILKKYEN